MNILQHVRCNREDMYWWKLDQLRMELAQGTLKESARLWYLLIFVLSSTGLAEFPIVPDDPNQWDRITSIGVVVSTVLGTMWAYMQNGGNAGHRFLERYLSISWVFLLRFMAVVVPIMIAAYMIADYLDIIEDATGPVDVAAVLLFMVFYYQGLGKHIRLVVAAEHAAQQSVPTGGFRPSDSGRH
ncbi:MAG TPA: hypothetical protein VEC06_00590 [Paucimonas sp.]|nr:hypothetical protein [Paucimonas sp.]